MIEFLAQALKVDVRYEKEEKIIIDERTGTVVSGINIEVSPIVITHGDITIKIEPRDELMGGGKVVNMNDGVEIGIEANQLNIRKGKITVANITRALHKLGAQTKRYYLYITTNIKRTGAINAKLEIM